jgi:hypothetical protein
MHEEEFIGHLSVGIEEFFPSANVSCGLHKETVVLFVVVELKKAVVIVIDEVSKRHHNLDLLFVHHDCKLPGVNEDPEFKKLIIGIFKPGHFRNLSDQVIKFLLELAALFQNCIQSW